MQFANKGLHVQTLNKALNELGYKTKKNETLFWNETKSQLMNFQRDHGLKASGILDAKTLLKMDKVLGKAGDREDENLYNNEEKSLQAKKEGKENKIIPATTPLDEKVTISVGIVPMKIKSNQEFFEFLDIQIFGRIIDAKWDIGNNSYKDYIGKETTCEVSISSLKKYLGITDAQWEDMHKNKKTSSKLSPAELRKSVQKKVKDRIKEMQTLSSAKRQFIKDPTSSIDYIQNTRILDLLEQLSDQEIADYNSKVSKETSNLEDIEAALKAYIENRNLRNEDKNSREQQQKRLAGLETLYKQYTTYIKFKHSHKSTLYERGDPNKSFFENALNKQLEELVLSLTAKGFTFESFEKLIKDYELSFRKETVRIAEDSLAKYKNTLFEQKKKLLDGAFITNLLEKIKDSKAKESYEEANDSTPRFYDNKLSAAEREFKTKMEERARSKKAEGNAAIGKLSSTTPLVEDNGFNKEGFAKVETQQELRRFLEDYINDQQENIAKIIDVLEKDESLSIYGFASLLQKSKEQQGIAKDSIFDLIINDKEDTESKKHIIKGLLIGILAIALGLLTFGTGTVAVLLAAGNFALGAYITYEEIEAYRTQLSAYKVNISDDEPSAVWVIIGVVGSVLDAAAVAKIGKQLVKAGRVFDETGDVAKTETILDEAKLDYDTKEKVIKALEEEKAAKLEKQEEIKTQKEKVSNHKPIEKGEKVEEKRVVDNKKPHVDNDASTMREIDQNAGDIHAQSIIKGLSGKGIPQDIIDQIIIRSKYIDAKLGNTKMSEVVGQLANSTGFKNPEDLLDILRVGFSKPKINGKIIHESAEVLPDSAKDLLNELETGLRELNKGDEVIISRKIRRDGAGSGYEKLEKGGNEIDVLNITKRKIIESKRVSGKSENAVKDRINAIIEKFTKEDKISDINKELYPNHFGQLKIDEPANPYFNLNKEQFIEKIKKDLFPYTSTEGGIEKIQLQNTIQELEVTNGQGTFKINKNEW
ncbi:peptidoglycan-binding domain-containing protein [Chryseobacterium aquaticum]|nr:peptidoglycan-binding domain-containing protein [Chryseobacterium aquaticum]